MNKTLLSSFSLTLLSLSFQAYASSTVNISIPDQTIIAAKSTVQVSLNALSTNTPYMITCSLNSNSPTQLDVSLTPSFAPKGGFGVTKLNNKPILKNSGVLKQGENTLSFMASISTNNKPNNIILKNLDDRFTISVKSCEAKPVTNVVAAGANKIGGGYFYVTNNLPYYLDITVGNYFPTEYCIYPYMSQYIATSTPYQDINVIRTHY